MVATNFQHLAAQVVDCQAYLPDFTLAETICAVAARKVRFLYRHFFDWV